MSHQQNPSACSFGAPDPNLLGSALKDNETPVLRRLKRYRMPSSDEDASEAEAIDPSQKSSSAALVGPVRDSSPSYVFLFILLTFLFLFSQANVVAK